MVPETGGIGSNAGIGASRKDMNEKRYKWIKIAPPGEALAAEEEIVAADAGHKKICIARWEGKLYAFAYKCPHAGGMLCDGHIDVHGNVVCPVHRYKYNIRNGYNSSGEGYYLSNYPVENRDDGVYVGFPESSIWDIFKK